MNQKYNPFDELESEIRSLPASIKEPAGQGDSLTKQDPAGRDIANARRRGTDKTVHQLTMRVAVRSSNQFKAWCDRNRLSYREGFDLLVPYLDEIKL